MDKVLVVKNWSGCYWIEVLTAHIHLVPINGVSDINFDKPKKNFSPDKMREA